MAEKRRGLGRGLGALFPEEQKEIKSRAIDVFFSSPQAAAEQQGSDLRKRREDTAETAGEKSTRTEKVQENPDGQPDAQKTPAKATAQKKAPGKPTEKGTSTKKGATAKTATTKNTAGAKVKVTGKAAKTPSLTPATNQSSADEGLVPVPGATFGEIVVNEIIPNTRQPREIFDEDELQELADSIGEVGVLQPIVIRPLSEPVADAPEARYELIMGERRWRASQLAGKETIPAIVRRTEDSDLLRDALLENLHRSNLNALEEAAAYQQLLDDFQCTQEELSRRIARSRPQISNTLRLLKLPPLVQRRVAAGVLSAGHARALLGLQDPAAMERLAQRIVAEGLSVRQVEEIVAIGDDTTPSRPHGARRGRHEDELNELAGRLSDRFNTRVKVNLGVTKGRIAIEFATIEDLNRILGNLDEEKVDVEDGSAAN